LYIYLEMLMDGDETLTEQEIRVARVADFDLASGYPQIPVSDHTRALYTDHSINEPSLRFSPSWTAADHLAVDRELEEASARFLDLDANSYDYLGVTFSGGIALDRALTAAIQMPPGRRGEHVHVVTTSPSIDVMKLFLLERRMLSVHWVESRLRRVGGLDRDAVVARIHEVARTARRDRLIVLLTSPENPTGEVWSAADIKAIANSCDRYGGVLILDHSFLLAGVHGAGEVPPVWKALSTGTDWISVWDTGKTFGLNEEKLGFLICGSPRTARSVRKALHVVQFDVSRRQKLFFTELFRRALLTNHAGTLRDICRRNLDVAVRLSQGSRISVRDTYAGSLTLIAVDGTGRSDVDLRRALLDRGVGVVAGRVFFHTGWRPVNLVRVALARRQKYFEDAFAHLVAEVERLRL
jgi:histidinol-phosphate/aromatic aminotransferase/cobyric acid decarboxylase-like protein